MAKFGQHREIKIFVKLKKVGWEGRSGKFGQIYEAEFRTVSESVSKVGIELLGQLKKRHLKRQSDNFDDK